MTRMSSFSVFKYVVDLCKRLESDGQEIKVSTRMKKSHFGVKFGVFIKNKNDILNNYVSLPHLAK